MCKSFHVSSTVIDPGYHILLSYHPHFHSIIQTVPGKYPHRIDLLTRTMYQTMQNWKRTTLLFYPILDKNGLKKQTVTSCQNLSGKTPIVIFLCLPDQSHFFLNSAFITTRRRDCSSPQFLYSHPHSSYNPGVTKWRYSKIASRKVCHGGDDCYLR